MVRINKMADDMEYNLKKQKDYQMQVDRKVQRSEIKKKLLID